MRLPVTSKQTFVRRREALSSRVDTPILLAAGKPRPRQYRANWYPFRATSHFLYLVGKPMPGAALLLAGGRWTLLVKPERPGGALWFGPRASDDELCEAHGVDEVRPLDEIAAVLGELGPVATLPTEDAASARWLSGVLGRTIEPSRGDRLEEGSPDAALADAMIAVRLHHDEGGLAQLRAAARVTAQAHVAGMRATAKATTEAEVCAAMIGVLRRSHMEDSFGPVVTVHGEVLHNEVHHNALSPGDLLLADVGGETPEGWAGDISRTWPVTGVFSPTQRDIYEIVLAAELAAIDRVRPGVGYRCAHEAAKRVIVQGLRDLGVLRGEVDGLLERGAAAIFFTHGVGHLLGLDAHDMEDLGDRAGYAPGRARSEAFGDRYLRLDRDLRPNMAVTIEPGFYQVPAILQDARYTGAVGDDLRRDVLARYADVRGIRIEDSVVVTDNDPEVLTSDVPKRPEQVEALVRAGAPPSGRAPTGIEQGAP